MRQRENLLGQKFGKLTVIEERSSIKGKKSPWLCRCDCGIEKEIVAASLKNGNAQSCGCLLIDFNKRTKTTHGLRYHPIYKSYEAMVSRCYNSKDKSYKNYGARGITVCKEWLDNLEMFFDWALPKYSKGLTLDRIDNNKEYSPSNCRWATYHQQASNRRNNSIVVGVNERNGKFIASLMIDGKRVLCKTFLVLEDAIKARKTAELHYNI